MIDENALKMLAKITAMESMLTTIAAMTYFREGLTPENVEQLNASIMAHRDAETFPGGPPEVSDLLAAEVAEATKEIQDQVLDKLRTISKGLG